MRMIFTLSTFLLFSASVFTISAEESIKKLVSKTIIGSEYSIDYSDNSKSETVNTKNNVFDGILSTYFSAYDKIGSWVGLDLGEKYVIKKITFCPRKDYSSRMLLGVFEGANNPDFGDAIPLYIIANAPAEGTMTAVEVNCSRGFRYVRYVGPMGEGTLTSAGEGTRCNVAELEFFGFKSEGDDSMISPLTNIPAVVIHTTDAEDVVVKEKYLKGIVTFISADGKEIYTDSTEIKGRGNSSWDYPKKPYRLKLNKKAKILGNPAKAKNWTLINNFQDKTLMRNFMAFEYSKRLGMDYTPAGQPVNVFLNGDYKGCYQFSDHIELNENKVNIKEMKETDVSGREVTGGYLIEIDQYATTELSWFRSGIYGIPVTIKSPKDDEIVMPQYNYIRNHFEQFLLALSSNNYCDPSNGYRRYLDTPSFIRHFLIGELTVNPDTYWSTYMFKDKDSLEFRVGPVWDFDIAFDNNNRQYSYKSDENWVYKFMNSYAGYDYGKGGAKEMVSRILSDPSFMEEMKETYYKFRREGIISRSPLVNVVSNYADQMDSSQKLNFKRWNIMKTMKNTSKVWGSYEGEVQNLKDVIVNRILWMDKKLNYVPAGTKEVILPQIYAFSDNGILELKGISEDVHVGIYNTMGSLVYSKATDSNISLPLSTGVYLVRLTDAQGKTKTLKCLVK